MTRPIVKICGLTRSSDARLCHDAGADLLGVIFAPSVRRVSESTARDIREAVPDARLVGVFTHASAEHIAAVARTVALDLVQLHGSDDPAHWAEVHRAAGVPVLPAVTGTQVGGTSIASAARSDPHVAGLLLDLPKHAAATEADRRRLWKTAGCCGNDGIRVFLAGGLDAAAVPQAVTAAGPYGLDVSRGVESAPGVKDPERVRSFLAAAHDAEVIGVS